MKYLEIQINSQYAGEVFVTADGNLSRLRRERDGNEVRTLESRCKNQLHQREAWEPAGKAEREVKILRASGLPPWSLVMRSTVTPCPSMDGYAGNENQQNTGHVTFQALINTSPPLCFSNL